MPEIDFKEGSKTKIKSVGHEGLDFEMIGLTIQNYTVKILKL